MRSADDDIDALMRSVVGGTGEVVPFPTERARKSRVRPPREERPSGNVDEAVSMAIEQSDRERAVGVEELSAALNTEIATNEAATPVEPPAVIDPRTVPVRFSNLKHLARSALHYWDAVQLGREDTLAMRLGRGAHAITLGMPVIRWTGKTRHGKAWDAFKRKHADKEILNNSEWEKSVGVANAIRRHPIASRLLFTGDTVLEQTIEWEFLGRKCTSRPDARRGSQFVADLKTTQCAEPEKFKRDALWRGYNAQLAFYGAAAEALTGEHVKDLYVIAVESKRPYAVTVLQLDDETRLAGEKLYRAWFERLLVCEDSDHWPAYADAIVPFGTDVALGGTPDNPIDLDQLDEELFA